MLLEFAGGRPIARGWSCRKLPSLPPSYAGGIKGGLFTVTLPPPMDGHPVAVLPWGLITTCVPSSGFGRVFTSPDEQLKLDNDIPREGKRPLHGSSGQRWERPFFVL